MSSKNKNNPFYILDSFSLHEIKNWEKKYDKIADYCRDHYTYFAHKRLSVIDSLHCSLSSIANKYQFNELYRIVDYKFSNNPLSVVGSIMNDPGGRFNFGDLDQLQYPRFGALYLAEDFETAFKEKYGQTTSGHLGLSIEELKMCKGHTAIEVRGNLNSVIDICEAESLSDFFEIIKHIGIPLSFISRAYQLKINSMRHVKNVKELLKTLLTENWREMPMIFDIPSNSQIFGQLAYTAGVEGIIYRSVKNNKKCVAIFPNNLKEDSYVEISSDHPKAVIYNRIDITTKENFLRF